MRKPVLLFLIPTALLCAQVSQPAGMPQPKPAKMEGQVVDSISGEPLAKVSLTLSPHGGAAKTQSAASEADGSFHFKDLSPGKYSLFAEKPGYVRQMYGARRLPYLGTNLELAEGQDLSNIVFKLIPQGVISGKVMNEDGDPMSSVSVEMLQYGYDHGERRLVGRVAFRTNDVGEYRIPNLTPGTYYLQVIAKSPAPAASNVAKPADPNKPELDYADQYYPDAFNPSGAAPLQVTAGAELTNIDVHLRKIQVYRIRGKVIDGTTGAPATDARMIILPTPSGPTSFFLGGSPSGGSPGRTPQGKFELSAVAPGSYIVAAQIQSGDQALYGSQRVTVVDQNIENVEIRVPPLEEVSGTVELSGRSAQPTGESGTANQSPPQAISLKSISIALTPDGGIAFGDMPLTGVAADGTFTFQKLPPDKYRVNVNGLPSGTYFKSVRVGGQGSDEGIADLTAGGPIEVDLSMGAATVNGVVVDADSKPVSGAIVTLVPGDASMQNREDLYRQIYADQNGRFQIQNLAPGAYALFAWEDIEPGAFQDPAFRKPFESKSVRLKLSENDNGMVELHIITSDEVARVVGQ